MRRIILFLFDLVSLLFLAAAYLVDYFTKRKLGMNRWVVYQQMKYAKILPLDSLKYLAALILFVLLFLLIRIYIKKTVKNYIDTCIFLLTTADMAFYLFFTILLNVKTCRSYYLCMPLIGLSVLMLLIRNLLAVKKDEK